MANQIPPPDGEPVQFGDELDEVLSLANPNPERVGCPGAEVLADLAARRRPIGDPGYEHLLECSPCYREFRVLQAARSNESVGHADGSRTRWVAIAATALLVSGIAMAWFLLGRQQAPREVASAGREGTPAVIAEIDLRPFGASRNDQGTTNVTPVSLPASRVEVTLLLPVGSEPGAYDVQLLDGDLKSFASSRGDGEIENYITTLRAALDLRSVPGGTYSLAIRRQGESWRMFAAKVQ